MIWIEILMVVDLIICCLDEMVQEVVCKMWDCYVFLLCVIDVDESLIGIVMIRDFFGKILVFGLFFDMLVEVVMIVDLIILLLFVVGLDVFYLMME